MVGFLVGRSLRDGYFVLSGIERRHNIVQENVAPTSRKGFSEEAVEVNIGKCSQDKRIRIDICTARHHSRNAYGVPCIVRSAGEDQIPRINGEDLPANCHGECGDLCIAVHDVYALLRVELGFGLELRVKRGSYVGGHEVQGSASVDNCDGSGGEAGAPGEGERVDMDAVEEVLGGGATTDKVLHNGNGDCCCRNRNRRDSPEGEIPEVGVIAVRQLSGKGGAVQGDGEVLFSR